MEGWQSTIAGKQEVKKALTIIGWIKDKEGFDKAYNTFSSGTNRKDYSAKVFILKNRWIGHVSNRNSCSNG